MNKQPSPGLRWFFFALLFLSYPALWAQELPAWLRDSLDIHVKRGLENWKTPGLAIAIVKDGKVLLQKGWGQKTSGRPEPVDEHTLFHIGSNTKAFTGTLMALLDHEGKLSLADPVKKWVPGFTMNDPWVGREMTLTDILCHRLGYSTFQGDLLTFDTDFSAAELNQGFGKMKPDYPYRTTWGYCNYGYAVAGQAIKQATGLHWAELLRERIFKPLGMDRSLALTTEVEGAANMSTAHSLWEGAVVIVPYMYIDAASPCASIASSVNDMSKWAICLLDSGRYQGKQVIPWEAIERSRRPESIVGRSWHRFNTTHYELYGLGWFLQDYEGRELVMHDGGVDGFITTVTLVPEENLGIIILTNTDANALSIALRWEILDAFLGLPGHDYPSVYLPRFQMGQEQEIAQAKSLRDSIALNLKPSLPLEAFAGTYQNLLYGKIIVKAEGGVLKVTPTRHPGMEGTLKYIGNNRFVAEYNRPMFGLKVYPFKIKGKKVESFVLTVNDFLDPGFYVFLKN